MHQVCSNKYGSLLFGNDSVLIQVSLLEVLIEDCFINLKLRGTRLFELFYENRSCLFQIYTSAVVSVEFFENLINHLINLFLFWVWASLHFIS